MTVEFLDVYGDGSFILNVSMISYVRVNPSAPTRCFVRSDGKETELKMTPVQLMKKSRFVRE